MRGTALWLALVVLAATSFGCKQTCFPLEADLGHFREMTLPDLENNPNPSPAPFAGSLDAPSDITDPDRKPRPMTLMEAIAIALENGNTGIQNVTNPGLINDNLVVYAGRDITTTDYMRVIRLDPAIAGSDIESSLSKFDPLLTTSMNWSTVNLPENALNIFQSGDQAQFSSSLLKPLPTGGLAGVTFNVPYTNLANPPSNVVLTNPAYTPSLQFQFEQPLLQGFGVEINQLRSAHPNSILTPFASNLRSEGILITRIKFDQARTDFERAVAYMLLNVESAYWNLYSSYWSLYSREQGLRQAFEAFRINRLKFEQGKTGIQDLAQARRQYESFRGQRITALGRVLEAERQLRGLLNLPAEDGCRIIPADTPTLTPYRPDWTTAWNEAMALRPELILARQNLKLRQMDLILQKNSLLPDLRFTSTYNYNGLGNRLDGSEDNAFRSLASGNYPGYGLGLRYTQPIGFRDAHAQERIARLNLARAYFLLQDQQYKTERALLSPYRNIIEQYELIGAQRSLREAAGIELEARTKQLLAGIGTLDFLLEAQQVWANALQAEYEAIVQYNIALAQFEFNKGTILRYDNVTIGEGPLPNPAQVRAVEHERERTHAIILRQRANPILKPSDLPKDLQAAPVGSIPDDHSPLPKAGDFIYENKSTPMALPQESAAKASPIPEQKQDKTP